MKKSKVVIFDSQNYISKLIPEGFNKALDFKNFDKSVPIPIHMNNDADASLMFVVYSHEELLSLLDLHGNYKQTFLCSFEKEILKKAPEILKVIPIDISTHNFELEDKLRDHFLKIV
ncbi:hypothetical protein [Aestuariivivens insulae]|uniref:hypothetical protein n=1 Tax=Aestuariivivens insulae TaxID=1621988 RepID=UPI001F590910|nr:hypothetical protein [Aestuariivivens insulae]